MLYIHSLSLQVHYRQQKTSTEKWALRKRCEEFQMRERAKELKNFMTITAFIASHSTANHHHHHQQKALRWSKFDFKEFIALQNFPQPPPTQKRKLFQPQLLISFNFHLPPPPPWHFLTRLCTFFINSITAWNIYARWHFSMSVRHYNALLRRCNCM